MNVVTAPILTKLALTLNDTGFDTRVLVGKTIAWTYPGTALTIHLDIANSASSGIAIQLFNGTRKLPLTILQSLDDIHEYMAIIQHEMQLAKAAATDERETSEMRLADELHRIREIAIKHGYSTEAYDAEQGTIVLGKLFETGRRYFKVSPKLGEKNGTKEDRLVFIQCDAMGSGSENYDAYVAARNVQDYAIIIDRLTEDLRDDSNGGLLTVLVDTDEA